MIIRDQLIAFSITLAILITPLIASAETSDTNFLLEAPAPVTLGSVTYVSGGVGDSEAEAMRAIAKNYALEVIFIQKLKQREEFLAAVNVQIKDHHDNLLLDIVTDGPYLLANLPAGHYQIIAQHNGVVKQQWLMIIDSNNKNVTHKKVIFMWPILEDSLDGSVANPN